MWLWLVFLTGTFGVISAAVGGWFPEAAEVVAALHQHIRAGAVLLTYSTHSEVSMMDTLRRVHLRKTLAKQQVQTAEFDVLPIALNGDVVDAHVDGSCFLRRPLIAILPSEENGFLRTLYNRSVMAGPKWLFFAQPDAIVALLEDVDVPFDAELLVAHRRDVGDVHVTQMFRVAKSAPILQVHFARLTQGGRVLAPRLSARERKGDLRGLRLRAAVVHFPPFSFVTLAGGSVVSSGFSGDVWQLLSRRLNCTIEYVSHNESILGSFENATGIFGMLVRREVDLLGQDTDMLSLNSVEFLMPLLTLKGYIFLQMPPAVDVAWSTYAKPFDARLWLSVVATTLLLGVVLATISAATPDDIEPGDALVTVVAALSQQGSASVPRSPSGRLVFLVVYTFSLLVGVAFSASLVSFFADHRASLPFEDLRGMLQDGRYQLGASRNSHIAINLFKHASDPVQQEIYQRLMQPNPSNFPQSTRQGLERVCADKFALLSAFEFTGEFFRSPNACRVVTLPGSYFKIVMSTPLPKNSPYRDIINYHMIALRDHGLLPKLCEQLLPKISPGSEHNAWAEISHRHTAALFCGWIAAILVSLAVLAAERCVARSRGHACNHVVAIGNGGRRIRNILALGVETPVLMKPRVKNVEGLYAIFGHFK